MKQSHPAPHLPRILVATLAAAAVLVASSAASAGISKRPFQMSKASFRKNGEAIEVLTFRGEDSRGGQLFLRASMANAFMQGGDLELTFKYAGRSGKVYGKQEFERGDYDVFSDRLGVKAGKHIMEVKDGRLHFDLTFEDGLHVVGTVRALASMIRVQDFDKTGTITRRVLAPVGRLEAAITDKAGTKSDVRALGFLVHAASTVKAHRSFNRNIQMHHVRGGQLVIVDYAVGPKERNGRLLGFVAIRDKGRTFVGEVVKEVRSDEHRDSHNGYQVPWTVAVVARGTDGGRGAVQLKATRQTRRKDDLAKRNFAARQLAKAVDYQQITYTLSGEWAAEWQKAGAEGSETAAGKASYKYAQVR